MRGTEGKDYAVPARTKALVNIDMAGHAVPKKAAVRPAPLRSAEAGL